MDPNYNHFNWGASVRTLVVSYFVTPSIIRFNIVVFYATCAYLNLFMFVKEWEGLKQFEIFWIFWNINILYAIFKILMGVTLKFNVTRWFVFKNINYPELNVLMFPCSRRLRLRSRLFLCFLLDSYYLKHNVPFFEKIKTKVTFVFFSLDLKYNFCLILSVYLFVF